MKDYADKRWLRGEPVRASLAERAAAIRAIWGPRLAAHPNSTFRYTPAARTDIRVTLRRAGLGA